MNAVMAPAGTSAGAQDAAEGVARGEQDAAQQKRTRHHEAIVAADARAQQMRNDEADEPDGSGQRNGRRRQHRAAT